MIQLSNATILAVTKLRTRRIRTIITVVTSSLLFSCLVAALVVAQGSLHSINAFNALGLGSRYIVQATPPPFINEIYKNTSIEQSATQIYKQTISEKKAAAKKLGATYDPSTEVDPVIPADKYSLSASLNLAAPAAAQAVDAYLKLKPTPGIAALKSITQAYHPTALYETKSITPDGKLQTMFGGAEKFSMNAQDDSVQSQNNFQHDVLQNGTLEFAPSNLTKPFLLSHIDTTAITKADEVPIILPYNTVQYLLDTPELPGSATSEQKLAQVTSTYKAAGNLTFTGCYRNEASASQIQLAISTAADILANKDNKSYQKPSLIYGLPASNSCAAAPILSDTRTTADKKAAAKQAQFDAMFGTDDTPVQRKITFHVVGIVPGSQSGAPNDSAAGILQGLVGSSLSGSAAIPQDLYNELPSAAEYNTILSNGKNNASWMGVNTSNYYAEFSSAPAARTFINSESCSSRALTCPSDKPFQLNAFGSNSIAIKDLQNKFAKVFRLAGLIVVALAIIIMSSTVGRMLADGRRETAVFRAVGAERADISIVYGVYTLILSGFVALISLGFGLLIGYEIDRYYWRTVTLQAQLAFGGSDQSMQFHLFSVDGRIWLVALAAILCGIVSMLFPLLRNVRRSPIKDMRDE